MIYKFVQDVCAHFTQLANKQEDKGVVKYGEPLNPSYEYNIESKQYEKIDWLEMTEEELVDGFKYIQMEKHRRESKRQAIEELTFQANTLIENCQAFCDISELAHQDLDRVKDLLDKIQEVNSK